MTDQQTTKTAKAAATATSVTATALDEMLDRWQRRALNLGVMARATDGTWPIAPKEAARKLKATEREIEALRAVIAERAKA
jgi:hypothetical protein